MEESVLNMGFCAKPVATNRGSIAAYIYIYTHVKNYMYIGNFL